MKPLLKSIHLALWGSVIFLMLGSSVFARSYRYQNYHQSIKPKISAGAAFNIALHNGQIQRTQGEHLALTKPTQAFGTLAAPYLDGPATDAINYEQDSNLNNGAQVPPDNAASVGPNHVVIAVNTAIEWYTKTDRVQQHSESLNDFFADTNPSDLFDPRVVYDPYDHRYVVIADEQSTSPSNINYIHLAVSMTDDPNDGWYFQRIQTKTTIDGKETWLDFPGLAVSDEAIYITGNMFDFNNIYVASRLWILDKGLYNGSDTSSVAIFDVSTEAGLSDQAFTLIPSRMYGPQHVIDEDTVGTFLFSTEWDDGNGNDDLIAVFWVTDPLGHGTGPLFSVQFLNPGQIHNNDAGLPEAPQKDSDYKIDFGDTRAQSCFWKGDTLVGAFTVNPLEGEDAGQATVFWFTAFTDNLPAVTLDQQGFVGAEDIADTTFTGFPAVAINYKGDIGIGFSASASSIYAGAYFTVHQSTDASGAVQPSQVLHEGLDYYLRTFNPFHVGNRWGDYSSLSLDPENAYNFWVYNQYAWTRGDYDPFSKEDGRWATAFGKINPSDTQAGLAGTTTLSPQGFTLEQNYPNPFNASTRIRYYLPKAADVQIGIYNARGQKVANVFSGYQNGGEHELIFDGNNLASGIYFCTLKAGAKEQKIKMILLK